ncbi:LysR family transcriptional regulator [Caryophanon tenue]|uniref:HTH lysR-type domain-containing protein n=1 Tax=Caryophanon tenue TaxID=33978 RepID=A0A1C0YND7_9BACL|nr:LysR family transcriptional regulator [Caryophanon tenue]OCS88673.1 hypothetical protein A6M13_02170 [Caryophanon tenue]
MLELLQIFVKVYECRNFTKASELLFISQPTISLKMKQLEQQLQVTLFIRQGPKSIQPTAQADYLYEQSMKMIELWHDTAFALHHEDLEEITCTIACSNTFGLYYLPDLMPSFIARFPNVEFTLKIMNSEEAVQQLYQHEADLAFIEKPIETAGLYKKVLFKDELVLAGKATAPHWLMRENHSGIRFFNELYIAEHSLSPTYMYINNGEMMKQLLKRGVGRAVVSKLSVDDLPYERLPDKYNRNMYIVARTRDVAHPLYAVEKWIEEFFSRNY